MKIILLVSLMLVSSLTFAAQISGEKNPVNSKYVEISRLTSIKERKEWFSAQTPEDRASVWREHLTVKLKTSALTDKQRNYLTKVRDMLTPELLESVNTRNFAASKQGQTFTKTLDEGRTLFTADELNFLFYVLGDSSTLDNGNVSQLPIKSYIKSKGGDCYYIGSNGKKTYVDKKFCN